MYVPDINLRPSAGRAWGETWKRTERLAWGLLLAGWMLLFLLLLLNIQSTRALRAFEAQVVEARREAVAAEQRLAQREARLREIVEILRRLNHLESQVALRHQTPPFAQILESIRIALPPRVTVETIRTEGEQIIVEGEAGSSSLVVEFVRALEEHGTATRVTVDQIEHRNSDASPFVVYYRLILEEE